MIRTVTIILFFVFLILNVFSTFSFQNQKVPDSLLGKNFDYLRSKVYENATDSSATMIYIRPYLLKARIKKDTSKIANAFYYISGITKNHTVRRKYLDSMIFISKNLNTRKYPALSYYAKGNFEYDIGNYKDAFDLYLKTSKLAEENKLLFYDSKKNIAIIKSRIGENKTALKEIKECYTFYRKHKEKDAYGYLSILFALSDSYNLNKHLDSASFINNLGYKESPALNFERYKYQFTLNEGINQYDKKNYSAAKDSLELAAEILKKDEDLANLSMAHFFLGKTLKALGEDEKAIASHVLVDSIFQQVKEIMPNNRENYEILIDYYKQKNDINNQLKYIKRLITVDSVLHTNYRYLIKNVVQNYDRPRLLSEKQAIINQLEDGHQKSYTIIYILLGVSGVLLILWIINHKKQQIYKQRFEKLYNAEKSITKMESVTEDSVKAMSTLQVPESVIADLIQKLSVFEKEQHYLEKEISIASLAKDINTNTKYLSHVINIYKKKQFQYYINELRIDHAVHRLKTEPKFRNYTIQAIALESGFKKATTFSSAFYKYHGIQPSYFIKKLYNLKENKKQ